MAFLAAALVSANVAMQAQAGILTATATGDATISATAVSPVTFDGVSYNGSAFTECITGPHSVKTFVYDGRHRTDFTGRRSPVIRAGTFADCEGTLAGAVRVVPSEPRTAGPSP